MAKLTKNYKKSLEEIGTSREGLSIDEAVDMALKTSKTKFDGTVEIHVNLNIDVKHADQMVRGTVVLPNGTGKTIRIAAFVNEEHKKAALDAGADLAGLEELVEAVQKGEFNFDVAVAMPETMKDLGKIAKALGPKGLMPSPKAGTVTQDIANAIKELKKGQVEFKADKFGILHNGIGKVSFGKDKIVENLKTLLSAAIDAKPAGVKGQYIESIAIATTMGPSLLLDKNKAAEECK